MYITLSPINLEMVTLRDKRVPGEAMKQPLKVVPIGKELQPAIKKCDEKQGEKEDELCVLSTQGQMADVSMFLIACLLHAHN